MLVLTRKLNEEIVIGDNIRIKLLEIAGNRIRLGIAAPGEILVMRQEAIPLSQTAAAAEIGGTPK